jgi:hypothetical protein
MIHYYEVQKVTDLKYFHQQRVSFLIFISYSLTS